MATSKYAYFNTKSSSDWLTSWILHGRRTFLEDVCVAFFNVPTGNKDAMAPNPLMEEQSRHVYNRDSECLTGSTKCLIFKSMWNMLSSRHSLQEFYTLVCNCGDISMALKMAWHKMKRDWLLYLSVICPLGWSLAIQSGQGSQTFCRQSEGLATRD